MSPSIELSGSTRACPPAAESPRYLELLILQPSPFCNLDCDYCYLPNRSDRRRMDLGTLDAALWKVFHADLTKADLSIVWHAGEPTAVPRAWYEEAFAHVATHARGTRIHHHFQTNGVLIDGAWCDFFREHDVQVGVSIDGPAFLHDKHRKTRDGKGTQQRVMGGIERLRKAEIPFHVIGVLTRDALGYADVLFDFYATLGTKQVCFNVEEIETDHRTSSLDCAAAEAEVREFWRRFLARLRAEPQHFHVREIDCVLAALRDPRFGKYEGNPQNQAGRMLSVAWDGGFCFWSPELLGGRHPAYGRLEVGNVLYDDIAPSGMPALMQIQSEIDVGVDRCRRECAYFDFCLGGAPSNKLAEHGSFAATETMACRLSQKAVIDVVLDTLDRELPATGLSIGFAAQCR